MRAYRKRLSAVLALVAAFALAQTLCGCSNRIALFPELPQAMVLSPKAGDILTWKRPNSQITKFFLTFPVGLCALKPQGEVDAETQTVTVEADGDQVVECKVLEQSAVGGPMTFFYQVKIVTGSGASSVIGSEPTIMMIPIVGSCEGCALDRHKFLGTTGDPGLPYQISCSSPGADGVPSVIPPNIIVAPDVNYVKWAPRSGSWTITFTGPLSTPPCTNLDKSNSLAGLACIVNSKARPAAGAPPALFPYKVTASSCGNSAPSTSNLTLSLQASPVRTPNQ
jgi:hypothetical protein